MSELLQFSVFGIKNLEKEITINLSDLSVVNRKKANNVVGIFGYNASGKTAIILGLNIYLHIINGDFLVSKELTNSFLSKIINYDTKIARTSITFRDDDNNLYKHVIEFNNTSIVSEQIYLMNRRTLNEEGKTLFYSKDGKIVSSQLKNSDNVLKAASQENLSSTSIVELYIRKIFNGHSEHGGDELNELINIFNFTSRICIYLGDSDKNLERMVKLHNFNIENYSLINGENDFKYEFLNGHKIRISNKFIESFKRLNIRLEKFIKVFKEELISIDLNIENEGDYSLITRMFNYGNKIILEEYESSGIKQLIAIFNSLYFCSLGNIAFIDEMDVNLHSVYLSKLIGYFMEYGKGQLIFTSHNLESMNILKTKHRSIFILGANNEYEVRTKQGSSNPINQYAGGYLVSSPMNVESFDFVSVFEGE